MTKVFSIAGVAAALLVGSSALEAQTCLGTASFATGPTRAGVEVTFDDGATAYGAELAFGRAEGGFAGVNAALHTIDDLDESAFGIGGTLGLQRAVAAYAGAQLCPVLSAGYIFGPNFDVSGLEFESSTLLGSAGLAFGVPFQLSPAAAIVPFGQARVAYGRSSVSAGGQSESFSDTYGLLGLGAGVVLNQRITIRPTISIPVGLDDSDATFSIGAAVNFGAQRR